MELNTEFIKAVAPAVIATWTGIAPDVYAAIAENQDDVPLTKDEMVEITIDSNHLTVAGYKEVDQLIHDTFRECGYAATMNYLIENIDLPV